MNIFEAQCFTMSWGHPMGKLMFMPVFMGTDIRLMILWTNSRGAKCTLAVGFLKIDGGILPTLGETNAQEKCHKSHFVPKAEIV